MPSRCGTIPDISFAAFWWKTVTVGPWPSGPVWFVWVLLALDVLAALLYRTVARPASIRSAGCRWQALTRPAPVLPGPAGGHRHRLSCRRCFYFGAIALVRVRAVRGSGQPHPALRCCISSSAPASARRISIRACSPRMAGWRGAGRVAGRHARDLWLHHRADLHQARNTARPRPPAGMVAGRLRACSSSPSAPRRLSPSWRCSWASTMSVRACSIRMRDDAYGIYPDALRPVLWLQYGC